MNENYKYLNVYYYYYLLINNIIFLFLQASLRIIIQWILTENNLAMKLCMLLFHCVSNRAVNQ